MTHRPRSRLTDSLAIAATLVAGAYLIRLAAPYEGSPSWSLATWAVLATTALVGIVILALLLPSPVQLKARRWSASALALGLVVLAGQRWNAWRSSDLDWPPDPSRSLAADPGQLPPAARAAWGARIAVHLVTRVGHGFAVPAIPDGWPFPDDLAIAIDSTEDAVYVWARTAEDSVACLAIPLRSAALPQSQHCADRRGGVAQLRFTVPPRASSRPSPAPSLMPATTGTAWRQYRGSAGRNGTAAVAPTLAMPWRVSTEGPIRASVSVVGSRVLVGGHGTGALTALGLDDGAVVWRTRLPNWIHQDPLGDGRRVIVTFGDNDASFLGRSPSGIAAYDHESGRHLWTQFDESSVMTSGVLLDTTVVYASAAGILRVRHVDDGRLLASRQLPGGVIMAPLARHGDTLVATLDRNGVCAVRAGDLSLLWCRTLSHLRMLGHSAPAVAEGRVVLTGQATLFSLTPREFRHLGRGLQGRLIRHVLKPPGDHEIVAGMAIVSLELSTGQTVWTSPVFVYREYVQGHTSGTPVLDGNAGLVVLPNADTVVAFHPETGAIRWSAGAHRARGPVLVTDDLVLVAGRDGITEIHDLDDGAVRCVMERESGYDRGGPTLAGDLVIFASLDGEVEAVPLDSLRLCRGPGLHPPGPE